MEPNSPELRPLRGKSPLEGWVELFAKRDPVRAERYRYALSLFLGYPAPGEKEPEWTSWAYVQRSPETVAKYREAVEEFFEFLRRYKGRVVGPHEVTRRDAFDYAEWLAHRGEGRWDFSLHAEKLRDGDLEEELAVYETLSRVGPANIRDIARELPHRIKSAHPATKAASATTLVDEIWLENVLLWLMGERIVERDPNYVEVRREQPRAGLDEPVDPLIFTYSVVKPRPVSRATIAQRLSALSSFWQTMQKGENAADEALLHYNVFDDAVKAAMRGLPQEKRQASLSKRPTPELIGRVLAEADGERVTNKRNVALLWFLLLTGSRISATLRLRRGEPRTEAERLQSPGWLDRSTDPVTVVLRRKGGHTERIALPAYVLGALNVFWQHLAELGGDAGPDDPHYRYRLLLREPDAPLFPPLGLWGKNVAREDAEHGLWGYRKTLRRQSVQMLLSRLSKKAGLTEAERRRIHPHGFRHIAAEAMVDEGMPIRVAQAILGHASVQTTERYLPPEIDVVRRSAQNEILDYLAKSGFWAKPADRPALGSAPREIRTRGEEAPERPVAARPAAHEPAAPAELPQGPEPPPKALPMPSRPAGAALEGFGHETSQPAPTAPYEALAAGRKPADLVWGSSPQAKWLADYYPEWPPGYAMGRETLLPWWNKDAPVPWPVLAPAQAYPELRTETGLLTRLERLYDRWTLSAPTATLSLAKWLYFLGMLTVALEDRIGTQYSWVTYDAIGSVGDDIRSHDEEWLERWFEKNAHTFTTAYRRFKDAPSPVPGETGEEFWSRVDQAIGTAEHVPALPELPAFYFERDPVRAIYDRSPKEWKEFSRWLAKLTGTASSETRTEERAEQLDFFEKSMDSERERARRFIREFYGVVDELKEPARERSSEEKKRLEEQREQLRRFIKKEFGIKLPVRAEDPGKREQRVQKLLREAFPEEQPAPVKNVLGDARMFSPEAFRIDEGRHTIVHTRDFKERFAREHLGRDSECVMRRIARALWEKVRGWEAKEKARQLTEAEQKRVLFVTLLSQLSYVVPCPEDVERDLVQAGARYTRPGEVADHINRRIAAMAAGEEPKGPLDEIAADVAATYFEQTEPPEGTYYRPNPELSRNARRAGPHPLRLVAATFWPV